jgi:Tfp pilus assembly protein PilV
MLHQRLLLKILGKYLLNKKGQILPEAILGLVIFFIIFTGFINLVISYFRQIKYANDRIIANFLALSALEEIQGYKEFIVAEKNCALYLQNCITTMPGIAPNSHWVFGLIDENATSADICLNYDFTTSTCDNPPRLYLINNFYSYDPSGTSTIFAKKLTLRCPFSEICQAGQNVPLANATAVEAISEVIFGDNEKNKVNLRMIFITK